ncbi:MAG: hypothetical protein IPJ40_24385 [Saprospirales bacterium]|nr:hypothetical protein [Saprospirales bacterium]
MPERLSILSLVKDLLCRAYWHNSTFKADETHPGVEQEQAGGLPSGPEGVVMQSQTPSVVFAVVDPGARGAAAKSILNDFEGIPPASRRVLTVYEQLNRSERPLT